MFFYTLKDHVERNKRLNENEVKPIIRQLLTALDYYQNHNIAHKELKPENVILNITGSGCINLKLLETGMSVNSKKAGYRDYYLYSAPEVLLEKQYSPKSDMWSIGVLLYYMVMGQYPFTSDNDAISGILPQLCSLSEDCRNLIKQLLCVDSKERATLLDVQRHPFVMDSDFMAQPKLKRSKKCLDLQQLELQLQDQTELVNRLL